MLSMGLCVVALLVICIIHLVYRWSNPKCNGKLPPGSMGLPLIGETLQFFIPHKSMDISPFIKKRIERYGPIFRTSLVGRPVIISGDPEFNHFILQQEGRLVEMWYLDTFAKLFGQGGPTGTSAVGFVHKYIRSLTLNRFGPESIKEKHLPQVEEMVRRTLCFWSNQASVEVKHAVSKMAFDITSKELFSYDPTKSSENLSERFTNLLQGLMSFPLNIPGTTYNKCVKNQENLKKMMRDVIEERRASPEKCHEDYLDQVIEDMKKETFLTPDFAINIMFGILFASFESVSSALTVAIMLLTEHPQALQELKDEHEVILQSRENVDSPITLKEYKSMTFTSYVIHETLRMANVSPGLLRRSIKDIEINGYTIPKGWTILVASSALQLSSEKYKDPLHFNPWRWKDLESNVISKNFIPFGGGGRVCAGAEFSKVMMSVFLHFLVTQYRWKKIKGGDIVRNPLLGFKNGFHIQVSKKDK